MTDAESPEEPPPGGASDDGFEDPELEALREEVEQKYDFDDFGPEDMMEMTADEWEAVFDEESWVTGVELLDRVEPELKNRIARREVFAVLERAGEGADERVLAYSDEGYAVVYADGSLEGEGTVFRDVKPTLVLCSMPEFDVAEPPENYGLPDPEDVPVGSGEFGNTILQVVAAAQLVAGFVLLGAFLLVEDLTTIVAPIAGGAFVLAGVFLFFVVANARLSDRFRTEEYRNRLRAVQFDDGERPDFVPEMPESSSNTGADSDDDGTGEER